MGTGMSRKSRPGEVVFAPAHIHRCEPQCRFAGGGNVGQCTENSRNDQGNFDCTASWQCHVACGNSQLQGWSVNKKPEPEKDEKDGKTATKRKLKHKKKIPTPVMIPWAELLQKEGERECAKSSSSSGPCSTIFVTAVHTGTGDSALGEYLCRAP